MTYHTSVDLEDGRLNPSAYDAVVFAAHDEYRSVSLQRVRGVFLRNGRIVRG